MFISQIFYLINPYWPINQLWYSCAFLVFPVGNTHILFHSLCCTALKVTCQRGCAWDSHRSLENHHTLHYCSFRMHWTCMYPQSNQSEKQWHHWVVKDGLQLAGHQPIAGHVSQPNDRPTTTRLRLSNSLAPPYPVTLTGAISFCPNSDLTFLAFKTEQGTLQPQLGCSS